MSYMRHIIVPICLSIFAINSQGMEPARLPHLLGSCSTSLADSTYERKQNIRLAVENLSGTLLIPGAKLSFNKTVGKRELKAGYLPAPAIVHERLRPVLGGGICQVSSTLFNAVLLSDLKILKRYRHHTPINYLPLGMDATVSWGAKDFSFQNTSGGRIQIIGRVTEETITFELYGDRPLEEELRLETTIQESPSPHPNQASEPAFEITLYRIRSREGKQIEREYIHRDFYPARITEAHF